MDTAMCGTLLAALVAKGSAAAAAALLEDMVADDGVEVTRRQYVQVAVACVKAGGVAERRRVRRRPRYWLRRRRRWPYLKPSSRAFRKVLFPLELSYKQFEKNTRIAKQGACNRCCCFVCEGGVDRMF